MHVLVQNSSWMLWGRFQLSKDFDSVAYTSSDRRVAGSHACRGGLARAAAPRDPPLLAHAVCPAFTSPATIQRGRSKWPRGDQHRGEASNRAQAKEDAAKGGCEHGVQSGGHQSHQHRQAITSGVVLHGPLPMQVGAKGHCLAVAAAGIGIRSASSRISDAEKITLTPYDVHLAHRINPAKKELPNGTCNFPACTPQCPAC